MISLSVPQAPPSFSPPSATQPATQCETMPHTECHTCSVPHERWQALPVPGTTGTHRSGAQLSQRSPVTLVPTSATLPHNTIDRKKHTLWSATKVSGVVNRHNVFYRTFEKPHRCHQTAIVCSVFTPMWLFEAGPVDTLIISL